MLINISYELHKKLSREVVVCLQALCKLMYQSCVRSFSHNMLMEVMLKMKKIMPKSCTCRENYVIL
jgi:hypothetical protein